MARYSYCPVCQKNVLPKRMNKLIFIILLCVGIIPGVIYYCTCSGERCPYCKTKI